MESYDYEDPKMLGNWFDPYSEEHLRAVAYLEKHGYWSQEFSDLMDREGIIRHQNWQTLLPTRMGQC